MVASARMMFLGFCSSVIVVTAFLIADLTCCLLAMGTRGNRERGIFATNSFFA